MQILFQTEAQKDYSEAPLMIQLRDNALEEGQERYVVDGYRAYVTNHEQVDAAINESSDRWKINRLPKAELAILRLAVTELLYVKDVPDAVAINEAVELAKEFGEARAASYINGVLGKVAKQKETTPAGTLADEDLKSSQEQ